LKEAAQSMSMGQSLSPGMTLQIWEVDAREHAGYLSVSELLALEVEVESGDTRSK
jgi:hypothetical protein